MTKLRLLWAASLLLSGCANVATTTPAAAPANTGEVDAALKADVAAKLSKTFRNFQFDEIRKSELPGVYEVYTGGRIVYFAPEQSVLIFGELYRTDGHSITADKVAVAQALKAGDVDRSAAVVVGDGPVEVVEFVNPDCGYCRAAHTWFEKAQLEKNMKELVFFMPMQGHSEAEARAMNVICAPPALRRAAYDDLWSGKTADPAAQLKCDGAAKQLADQAREAVRFGVLGTPTYIVKGQVVTGFRQDQLQTLLFN